MVVCTRLYIFALRFSSMIDRNVVLLTSCLRLSCEYNPSNRPTTCSQHDLELLVATDFALPGPVVLGLSSSEGREEEEGSRKEGDQVHPRKAGPMYPRRARPARQFDHPEGGHVGTPSSLAEGCSQAWGIFSSVYRCMLSASRHMLIRSTTAS